MKKNFFATLLFASLLFATNVFGSNPTNHEQVIKSFYKQYCKIKSNFKNPDSLYQTCCTPEFIKSLKYENDGGEYDFLTDGRYDYELIESTVDVKLTSDGYSVSFKAYKDLYNNIECVNMIIYLNAQGKIERIKRPADGYCVPEVSN